MEDNITTGDRMIQICEHCGNSLILRIYNNVFEHRYNKPCIRLYRRKTDKHKHWFCKLTNGLQCSFFFRNNESAKIMNARKKQHELWHKQCRIQKRNNTEGIVEWVLI